MCSGGQPSNLRTPQTPLLGDPRRGTRDGVLRGPRVILMTSIRLREPEFDAAPKGPAVAGLLPGPGPADPKTKAHPASSIVPQRERLKVDAHSAERSIQPRTQDRG